MIDIQLISKSITVRKDLINRTNQRKINIENAVSPGQKAFEEYALEIEEQALKRFFDKMRAEFFVFTKHCPDKEHELYFVFSLPQEGTVLKQWPKIEPDDNDYSASCTYVCNYMPMVGALTGQGVVQKNKVYANPANSILLDPFIDLTNQPECKIYGWQPTSGARFLSDGISYISKDITDVISQAEDIIVELAKTTRFISVPDLTNIIYKELSLRTKSKEKAQSNMEVLQILQQVENINQQIANQYQGACSMPTKERIDLANATCATGHDAIKTLQSKCPHPIGVKVGGSVYCPICEQELIPGSVITIEKEAGGHNMGFIREKLAEILPLIPEVTPAQMVEYVDKELKTFSRQ